MSDASLRGAIEAALGVRVTALSPMSGGDIDRALSATLEGGRRVFVKVARDQNSERLAAEAAGLVWLRAADAIGVPEVLAALTSPPALVLSFVERGEGSNGSEVRLGRELAALHRAGAPCFGRSEPTWLATIPFPPQVEGDWARFYGEVRLLPLALASERRGAFGVALRKRIEVLARGLDDRVGPPEPPARLHGDLWAGNHLFDRAGRPFLFDPCAYGGHREVDLAMMRLFGGYSERTFDAYREVHPLAPGASERVALYQLLPLLAHCVLFGGGYASALERALDQVGA